MICTLAASSSGTEHPTVEVIEGQAPLSGCNLMKLNKYSASSFTKGAVMKFHLEYFSATAFFMIRNE